MVESGGEIRMWKWTELPRFATFCRQICEKPDLEYEDEFDRIRWASEEDVCRNPLTNSHTDPRFKEEKRRLFRKAQAPAPTQVTPPGAVFRVGRHPAIGAQGGTAGRQG